MIRHAGGVIAALVLGVAAVAHANEADNLSAARDLYSAAAYEDALVLLDQLRTSANQPEDVRLIEQYRAFCLLALGRTDQAERVIEAIVLADPSFEPSASEVSPSIRTAFRDARRRMLPAIIQRSYTNAKAAFDGEAFALAADLFQQVLNMFADPQVAPLAGQPPLSDIRILATGFHDLSVKAAAPLPSQPSMPVEPEPEQPAVPAPLRVYGPEDTNVVPPVIVRQSLPPFPSNLIGKGGTLEVVIDEEGAVEAVTMRTSLNPSYDRLAVAAAREWEYKPALKDGVPVKFRKVVQVLVKR